MSEKRQRRVEEILAELDKRIAAIDFDPGSPPAAPPAPPAAAGEGGGLRARLERLEDSLASSEAARLEVLKGFSTRIDAHLAALGGKPPEPPAVPIPRLEPVTPVSLPPLPPLPPLPNFARPEPPKPEPPAPGPLPQREEPRPLPRLELPSLEEPAPAPEAVETRSEIFAPPAAAPAAAAAESPALSPSTTARSTRVALLLVAGAAALIAALALLPSRHAPAASARFSLPSSHLAGLSLDHDRLLSLDPTRRLLFSINTANGQIDGIVKLPGSDLARVAVGSDCLWAITSQGKISQYESAGDHALRRTFDSGPRQGGPLYWDGKSLWVGAPGAVFQYAAGRTLSVTRSFPLPGITPTGLQVSGDTLWVLDGAARKLLQFRIGGQLDRLAAVDLEPWLGDTTEPMGLTVDSGRLWLVTADPGVLRRFELSRLLTSAR